LADLPSAKALLGAACNVTAKKARSTHFADKKKAFNS
jgi:hypothetical protein